MQAYLAGRTFQVRVGDSVSDLKGVHSGVPHGAVLAPLLFNLFTTDIPTFPGTNLAMFADDVLIYTSSFSANVARQKIQNHLHKLIPWYSKWKIGINASKCDAVVLSRRKTERTIHIPIKINNIPINPTPSIKYLGVVVDSGLYFHRHVTKILGTAFGAGQKLYALLNKFSPLSPDNKLLLYRQIIRPVLTYAAPVWSGISDSQTKRLQVMQNTYLRNVTQSERRTRIRTI